LAEASAQECGEGKKSIEYMSKCSVSHNYHDAAGFSAVETRHGQVNAMLEKA
jgi:hypothetical protein